MKKLNNHGWGLGLMLVFIGVFALAIIIIVIQANKLGIAGDMQYATPIPSKRPVVTVTPSQTPTEEPGTSYTELESKCEDVAVVYQERYYSSLQDGDSVYIEVRKLVSENLIDELRDSSNQLCSGYVKISKNGSFSYDAYIKCGSYETEGYLSYLDS